MTTIKRFLTLFLIATISAFSVQVWSAENDTHDFSQSISQLLNNNNSISSINIADQGYPIKSIEITCRYNKDIDPAVTIEVLVGGASYATTQNVGNNFNSTKTFTGNATGAVQINFTNLTGNGSGHGTFYVTNVRLTEGASASCAKELTISAGSTSHGTFDLNKTGAQKTCSGLVVTVTDIDPDDGYKFDHIEQSGVAAGNLIMQQKPLPMQQMLPVLLLSLLYSRKSLAKHLNLLLTQVT